ncbi:uncharacterized protein LOC141591194 [Silene latifolia]|uniref:uncharacterized protein LOC141591194 n=1 Tax=Silene latifolia TaxID=37657 RepID=UPI003D7745E8
MEDMDIPETKDDLFFILKRGTTMMNAIAALADRSFNPSAFAMIQVGKPGLDITVHVTHPQTDKQVFGFLRLKAAGLHEFVCEKPFTKLVSLLSIHNILKDATDNNDTDYIAVYVVSGTNRLCFAWGQITRYSGVPEKSVGLYNLKSEYATFPDVSYGFEAVIASTTWNNAIQQLLQIDPHTRSTRGWVTMTAATVEMELRQGLVVSTEENPELHDVWMDWKYWESLHKALRLTDKCSMYLVTDPPEHIMFRFKLQELGDLFYLTGTQHV